MYSITMAAHDIADDEPLDIANAAADLKSTFDEMTDLTRELSGSMNEVADGFASMSDATGEKRRSSARIDPAEASAGSAVADD